MTFSHWLVILAVAISIVGYVPYIRDTLKGKTKPNRVSWFMWSLTPFIGMAAALSAGADVWASVRTFLAGFLPLVVLIISFVNRESYWKLTFFDFLCGLCSLLAIFAWFALDALGFAILFAVIGDGFAALPTIFKAWKYPQTETGFTYATALVSSIIILPSIPVWNIENSAFQIYLVVANAIFLFEIYRKKFKISI